MCFYESQDDCKKEMPSAAESRSDGGLELLKLDTVQTEETNNRDAFDEQELETLLGLVLTFNV